VSLVDAIGAVILGAIIVALTVFALSRRRSAANAGHMQRSADRLVAAIVAAFILLFVLAWVFLPRGVP
jgi:hypothetical protein